MAEEVNEVAPELVGHDTKGRIDSVAYDKVYAMMLAELQKQHRLIEAQAETIHTVENRRSAIENRAQAGSLPYNGAGRFSSPLVALHGH